jgi:hypothetical protein
VLLSVISVFGACPPVCAVGMGSSSNFFFGGGGCLCVGVCVRARVWLWGERRGTERRVNVYNLTNYGTENYLRGHQLCSHLIVSQHFVTCETANN